MRGFLSELLGRDRQEWTALGWAAGLGAFGVVTGYAVFAAFHEASADKELLAFLIALGVAAAVSFGWECVRELIDRGRAFKDSPGPILVRAVGTFLIVLVVELFVVAWHKGAEHPRAFVAILTELVLGQEHAHVLSGSWAPGVLALVCVIWILLGALLSWLFVALILRGAPDRISTERTGGQEEQRGFTVMSVVAGAAIGVLVPVVLLGVILLFRLGGSLGLLVFDHVAWRENLELIANRGPVWGVLLEPLRGIDSLLWGAPWGRLLSVILVGGNVLVWFWKRGPALLITGAVGLVFLPALAHDVDVLRGLLLASLLLWLVPGVALGIAVPFLREPKARHWGIISAVSAVLLASLAMSQASRQPKLVAAALAFVLAGIFILAPRREEFSLLIALVSGLAIYALA